MTTAYDTSFAAPRLRIRSREAREAKAIFVATYPLFLTVGVINRARKIGLPAAQRRSVFAEAKAAANMCIPFAFMR